MSRIKLSMRRTIKSWKIFCAAKLNEANRMECCNSSEKSLVLFLVKSVSNELLGWFPNDLDSMSKFISFPNKSFDFNWPALIADKIGCDIYKWDWWYWKGHPSLHNNDFKIKINNKNNESRRKKHTENSQLVNWTWTPFLKASNLNNVEKHRTKRICRFYIN